MKAKKAMHDEHGPRHVTPAGRSVLHELFPKAEADELAMRSTLLRGLEHWLEESDRDCQKFCALSRLINGPRTDRRTPLRTGLLPRSIPVVASSNFS